MKRIRDRVAGLDIHRDTVVACCRVTGPTEIEATKETFPTTQAGLVKLAAFLSEAAVTTVAMEATGVYWKPVYYALEGLTSELWLCNAQHVKNVPGRKTDLSDAQVVSRCCKPSDGEAFNGTSTRDSYTTRPDPLS